MKQAANRSGSIRFIMMLSQRPEGTPLVGQETTQKTEMRVSPRRDGVETVAIGDRGADAQEENVVQLVSDVFRARLILDPGEVAKRSRDREGCAGWKGEASMTRAPNREPQ